MTAVTRAIITAISTNGKTTKTINIPKAALRKAMFYPLLRIAPARY
jgi:hypothetical protein